MLILAPVGAEAAPRHAGAYEAGGSAGDFAGQRHGRHHDDDNNNNPFGNGMNGDRNGGQRNGGQRGGGGFDDDNNWQGLADRARGIASGYPNLLRIENISHENGPYFRARVTTRDGRRVDLRINAATGSYSEE